MHRGCSLRLLRFAIGVISMGQHEYDDDDCELMSASHAEEFRAMSGYDAPIGTRAVEWENGGVSFVLVAPSPGLPLSESQKNSGGGVSVSLRHVLGPIAYE